MSASPWLIFIQVALQSSTGQATDQHRDDVNRAYFLTDGKLKGSEMAGLAAYCFDTHVKQVLGQKELIIEFRRHFCVAQDRGTTSEAYL